MTFQTNRPKDNGRSWEGSEPADSDSEAKQITQADIDHPRGSAKNAEKQKSAAGHPKARTTVRSNSLYEEISRNAEWARQIRESSADDGKVVRSPWFPYVGTTVGAERIKHRFCGPGQGKVAQRAQDLEGQAP